MNRRKFFSLCGVIATSAIIPERKLLLPRGYYKVSGMSLATTRFMYDSSFWYVPQSNYYYWRK